MSPRLAEEWQKAEGVYTNRGLRERVNSTIVLFLEVFVKERSH